MVKPSRSFFKKISKLGLKKRWEKEHSKVKISKNISPEKAAIHAYLCGDGYIKINIDKNNYPNYNIRVYPDNERLARLIGDLFKKEFNISPSIKKLGSYFAVQIKNKPVCINLLSLGTYGTRNWKIPRTFNKCLLREWLKCFFDCESNVDLNNRTIALKSVNYNGLLDIQNKLELFKINSKVYGPYQPKNEKHSKYGILIISGADICKYKRLINFNHPAKKKKLEQLIHADFV